ncbi:MAG: PAS domain S-box-containing protein [Oleiphilaceae bacterium]|jgi:PAS domain S-box-containing protein
MSVRNKDLILIVDDEPSNIWPLIQSLETDYEVLFATTGEKALNIAFATPTPDLILLDVNMPIMDGYDVFSRLKTEDISSNIPVVFVTANIDELSETKALEMGAIDYIKKPFSLQIVKARIKSILNLQREMKRRHLLKSHVAGFNEQLEESILLKKNELKQLQITLHHYDNKYNKLFPITAYQGHRQSILLVDDTPENLHILMKNLEDKYEIYCASSGEKALAIACSEISPDLFLLDIMMPDMDGYELCSRLKAMPDIQDTPIIFISAMDQEIDETKGFSLGAVDYITKPFSMPVVEARVANALQLKEAMDQRIGLTKKLEQLNHTLEESVKNKSQDLAQSQETLKVSEQKYTAIYENAIEGIFQSHRDSRIISLNPSLANILGYESAQDLLAQITHSRDFYRNPEDRKKMVTELEAAGEVNGFETQLKKKDTSHIWVSLSAKVIEDNKGKVIYQGFITDITARKKAQLALEELNNELESRVKVRTLELEQSLTRLTLAQDKLIESEKSASLTRLLVGIAHEINTPLGNVITSVSILRDKWNVFADHYEKGTVSKKLMDSILNINLNSLPLCESNLHRMTELIGSLQEMGVVGGKRESVNFNLNKLLELVVDSFLQANVQSSIRCTITGNNHVDVKQNSHIITTIINHLLDNSVKHGFVGQAEGKVHIDVNITGEEVIMTYEDNGVGISRENQKMIFDPFFTTARSEHCVGLGLNIISNLITQGLNGKIDCVDSNQGVKFMISFPTFI